MPALKRSPRKKKQPTKKRSKSQIGKSNRLKGNRGELELVKLLNDKLNLNIEIKRRYGQAASGGHDIDKIPYVAIEAKRHASLNFKSWWTQTLRQALESNKVPVLAYKLDYCQWVFVMLLSDVRGFHDDPQEPEKYVEMNVETFSYIFSLIKRRMELLESLEK